VRSFGRLLIFLLLCQTSCSGGTSDGNDVGCSPSFVFQKQMDTDLFFKGNTHTHTERSPDSTELIANVLAWYRNADYDFVVLTDHDVSSVPSEFPAFDLPGQFVAIAGEEVTSTGITPNGVSQPVHVNSICSNGTTVGGLALNGVDVALKDSVDRVIDIANAIPQVNHPNYHYALRSEDIFFAERSRLVEIANQSLGVNNAGDQDHVSTEQLWDEVLSEGVAIYGVASDDTHHLGPSSSSAPGKGWIQVAADQLTTTAICSAIDSGAFYSSTGVTLTRLAVSEREINLEIFLDTGSLGSDYVTTFTGRDGSVLKTTTGLAPTFQLAGSQQYVRATVRGPNGGVAWVQPYFVEDTNACGSP
jgi:hypothetical protein